MFVGSKRAEFLYVVKVKLLSDAYNRLLYLQNVSSKPQGNHKTKTYSKYSQDKEKGIKVHHYGKSSIHKGRQQETKEQKTYKTGRKPLTRLSIVNS